MLPEARTSTGGSGALRSPLPAPVGVLIGVLIGGLGRCGQTGDVHLFKDSRAVEDQRSADFLEVGFPVLNAFGSIKRRRWRCASKRNSAVMLSILPLLHLLQILRKPSSYFILFCQQLPVHLCSFFRLLGSSRECACARVARVSVQNACVCAYSMPPLFGRDGEIDEGARAGGESGGHHPQIVLRAHAN